MKLFRKKETLSDFLKQVGKIAEKVGENYYTAKIEITHYHTGKCEYQYTCYINSYNSYYSDTMDKALDLLRISVLPDKKKKK